MRAVISYKRSFYILVILVILALALFGLTTTVAHADAPELTPYYDSITLQVGDTLWDIAEEYAPSKDAGTIQNYIKMLQKINGIKRPEKIRAGSRITIVYYQ